VAFVAVLTVLGGVLMFTWPELWVTLAFHRGAFDELAVTLTATAAVGYAGLYVFNSLGRVAIAANFARGLGWRMAVTNGLLLLVYLGISYPLVRSGGFFGLAIAASASFCLGTVMALAGGLSRRSVPETGAPAGGRATG
jgi:peptidoglycan biosynthesis protein MviN/MurJ (putative lipid II flippase)